MKTAVKPTAPLRVDPIRLERSLCLDSFFDFFQLFWSEITSDPLVLNWHHEYLCERTQELGELVLARKPVPGDMLINISPGSTKSSICSVLFPAWIWARDPSVRMICGSYAYRPTAEQLAAACYRLMVGDKYRRLFPKVELTTERDSLIVNSSGGFRLTTSTGSFIQGMHSQLIIVDDPLSPEAAESEVELEKAITWMTGTLNTRRMGVHPSGPMLIIMQRLHQNDPSGYLLDKDPKIQHICLPAELTSDVRPAELASKYVDGVMDPVRLPREKLRQAENKMMPHQYAGQYLQSPIPRGGLMFHVGRIRVEAGAPQLVNVVRYWDKAGTEGGTGAFTVGVKMGVDSEGRYWVLDVIRGRWESGERERVIRQTAEIDGRGVLIGLEQEPGSGGKDSALATIRRLAGYRVQAERPTGDKAVRADPYSVQVNANNVCMVLGAWNRTYLEELQFFPNSRYKDQVDASSGAFGLLANKRGRIGALR